MSGTTLVIVDMQPVFPASKIESVKEGVLREVRLAKRRGDAVVVVEFAGYNNTHNSIMQEIYKCKLDLAIVKKCQNDGSAEVIQACRKHYFSCKRFRVCGVNRTACVQDTAEGLAEDEPHSKVEVVWDATADSYDCVDYDVSDSSARHSYKEGSMKKHKNIVVKGW